MDGHSYSSRILVLVNYREVNILISKINEVACIGWEQVIEVRAVNAKEQGCENLTEAILFEHYDVPYDEVISQLGLVDADLLTDEGVVNRVSKSVATLYKVVLERLKQLGLHWREYAIEEWTKSTLGSASPDEWVQQFSELGIRDVGRHLLKCLRVITDAEQRRAFKVSGVDQIGLRVGHAYIHEDEPGSSSIAIKNILEHMHAEGEVISLDLAKLEVLEKLEFDVLYVYEDGLWSGVEVVKRLKMLCEQAILDRSKIQIVFKYCVTSDAGLSAARLYAVQNAAGRFQFPSGGTDYHFSFLKSGVDTRFSGLDDRSENNIRMAIDSAIEPYAFSFASVWGDLKEEAENACSNIGSQLVRHYFERRAGSSGEEKSAPPDRHMLEKVDRLKLGAMGFASTIVFASSIPKPVLPLMWLDGDVSFNGKKLKWRPLFWDARRTGWAES